MEPYVGELDPVDPSRCLCVSMNTRKQCKNPRKKIIKENGKIEYLPYCARHLKDGSCMHERNYAEMYQKYLVKRALTLKSGEVHKPTEERKKKKEWIDNPVYWLDKPIEDYNTELSYGEYILPNNTQFPEFIIRNFGNFMITADSKLTCNQPQIMGEQTEPFSYQRMIASYMAPNMPYRGLLLFHDVGTGKTRSAITVAEKYRTELLKLPSDIRPSHKILVILPASLISTWEEELMKWGNHDIRRPTNYDSLSKGEKSISDSMRKNIIYDGYDFVTANASNTDNTLCRLLGGKIVNGTVVGANLHHRLVICDEVHNLVSRMIGNARTRKDIKNNASIGGRIYQMLMNAIDCKFLFLSATPVLNSPFELGILFNILKGYIKTGSIKTTLFPTLEEEFDRLYIDFNSHKMINVDRFQKSIMGMISYYYAGEGDVFPDVDENIVNCVMSETMLQEYDRVRGDEMDKESKMKSHKVKAIQQDTLGLDIDLFNPPQSFRTRSRQISDFTMPPKYIRPSPHSFQSIYNEISNDPTKWTFDQQQWINKMFSNNKEEIAKFTEKFKSIPDVEEQKKYLLDTLSSKMEEIGIEDNTETPFTVDQKEPLNSTYAQAIESLKSSLHRDKMIYLGKDMVGNYSVKMATILSLLEESAGPCFVYSNYVQLEGLGMFSIVLEANGYEVFDYHSINEFNVDSFIKPFTDKYRGRYVMFSGDEDAQTRKTIREWFNSPKNIHGEICKIFMGSPAAAEGISLKNVRQVHIMEPHWNNVRIKQVIGRATRICSHSALPPEERHVDVYRYIATEYDENEPNPTIKPMEPRSTDQFIQDIADRKEEINKQFLQLLKNTAFDCIINLEHNKTTNNPIECFKFAEGTKPGAVIHVSEKIGKIVQRGKPQKTETIGVLEQIKQETKHEMVHYDRGSDITAIQGNKKVTTETAYFIQIIGGRHIPIQNSIQMTSDYAPAKIKKDDIIQVTVLYRLDMLKNQNTQFVFGALYQTDKNRIFIPSQKFKKL